MVERAARNVPWLAVETPPTFGLPAHARRRVVFERAALLALEEALGQ